MGSIHDAEYQELKIIYKEIIDGCSYIDELGCFIKHLTELEYAELARRKAVLVKKYQGEGILCEKDRMQQLIDTEQWSAEKEDQIATYEYIIRDNEKNIKNVIVLQQPTIQKIIDENKQLLTEALEHKKELIGLTAEDLAERDNFHYLLSTSFFKDKELKSPALELTEEVLENDDFISKYALALNATYKKFHDENLRKIAVLPFFLNTFTYSKDSLHTFLGKPVIYLTSYQVLLFSYGTRNLNILSNTDDASPPELLSDTKIEDIVNWYDLQYSVILGKRKAGK